MTLAYRDAAAVAVGDTVRVQPATTDFDRPIWTMREKGKVTRLGRSRVWVALEGAEITFKPKDLVRLERAEPVHRPVQDQCLDRPVKVFIVSRRGGGCERVLWVMSERDARAVCQDPRTTGRNYGLHWTAAGVDELTTRDLVADDGQHAAVLADLGVTVLASKDMGVVGLATPLTQA